MSSLANQILIYVDGVYGSDANTGGLDSPYLTLSKALQEVKNGGIITLQNGTYSLNGYGSINKNVSIIGANGSSPILNDEFNFVNAQGLLKNLRFVDQSTVIVNNSGFGGFEIKSCDFDDPDYPIQISSANYVAIHQSRFYNYLEAIRVSSCRELTIGSNYFYSDTAINGRAIYSSNVEWLDVYHNTIYGAHSIGGGSVGDLNLRVVYILMTPTILSQKKVSLPSFSSVNDFGYDVAVNVVNGPTQEYGKDYTVTDSGITINWSGLGLDGNLRLSDTIRVMYSEAATLVTGEAISAINVGNSNSRVDSNNITDASVGVYFTDNIRVRFNNFDNTSIFISGTPTDGGITGCITGAPNYVSAAGGNFNLQADSPDIDSADPERWNTILREMGIGRISGMEGYTGISLPTGRPGITPFNRNYDKVGLERLSRSDRDDIGAYEYPTTGTNPEADSYIAEYGFDVINLGSVTGPFATIDRGFTGTKNPQVVTNPLGQLVINPDGSHVGITGILAGATGYQYGRYISKNLDMNDLNLLIGAHNKESIAFIHSALPSNTPTGVYVGPPVSPVSGDTGSTTNPYLTISDALLGTSYATTIYVKPGIYPTFEGRSGKKLVGVNELNYLSLNTNRYARFDAGGWTGSDESLLLGSSLLFDVGVGFTGGVESLFEMSGNIDVRFNMFIDTDVIEVKFYNSNNYISVSKSSGNIVIRHFTGGVSYTALVASYDSVYKLFFTLVGSLATIKITGASTSINKIINLISDYEDLWKMGVTYRNYGNATGGLSSIIANAEYFTGAFGATGTSMSRKVYGVKGETGLTEVVPTPMIFEITLPSWQTSFYLPLNSAYDYNFTVDWGDGSDPEVYTTNSNIPHSYPGAGTYDISITENEIGGFPTIWFLGSSISRPLITNLKQWGTNTWVTMRSSFYYCFSMVISATDGATAKTGGITDFSNAWHRCASLTSFPVLDVSGGTDFSYAWYRCENLTSFPVLDVSSGTDFSYAWYLCTSLTSFPALNTHNGINFTYAWYACMSLTGFPTLDVSKGEDFSWAWYYCIGLTSFPVLDVSSSTNFYAAWGYCSSLTSFPVLDVSSGTNFEATWRDCTGLTSFPSLDVSSGTDFSYAWHQCSSLTSFPSLDVSSGTDFSYAWYQCAGLTSFPVLDVSSGLDFSYAWYRCTGLTSFPALNMISGITFSWAWYQCTSLTSFGACIISNGTTFNHTWHDCTALTSLPMLDTSSGMDFEYSWLHCQSLNSFPTLDVSSGTNFRGTWEGLFGLTSFPALDVSNGTTFDSCWAECTGLTSFPVLNVSSCTNFLKAWYHCSSLTSFPVLDVINGTNFSQAWEGCTSLTSFPVLDVSNGTNFTSAWYSCGTISTFSTVNFPALNNGTTMFWGTTIPTAAYSQILVNLEAYNPNNGVTLHGGSSQYDVSAVTARANLVGRSWSITDGGPA